VFGAGRDAVPVCDLAKRVGLRVVVIDDRAAYATAASFPLADEVRVVPRDGLARAGLRIDRNAAVLVMTHHFLRDLEILAFVLPTDAFYLGVLGPARRTELLLAELASRGADVGGARARLRAPVGVDIGSESAEEIALSVLAEIQAVYTGSRAGFLRDREGPIHDVP
jgi:xanthine/CO dehydrogenase XdhC/CoxF family maturation factor